VADSDNNRIRSISFGQVVTIAGDGSEGYSGDTQTPAAAELNSPRAVAVSGTVIAISDTENQRVREITLGVLNTVAGQPPAQAENVVISGANNIVYGTGVLSATLSNGASPSASGLVTFYDYSGSSSSVVGTALLSANAATLDTSLLAAGTHQLVASYAGDANNAAVTSGVYVLVVTPMQLTAVANAVKLFYGQPIPTLTGALTGVLAQDAGNVSAIFSTTATSNSAPGTYPIAIALTGSASGNYTVALANGSGSVLTTQAPSKTTLTSSSQTPILGTSATLTATVASSTTGTPTGTVSFYNGSTLLNSSPVTLSGGVATMTLAAVPAGSQSLTATYSGDTDFLANSSVSLLVTGLSPDFSIAASPAWQTVLPSQSVKYIITLTPVNSTFVYPVSLSVSGLPATVKSKLCLVICSSWCKRFHNGADAGRKFSDSPANEHASSW
jgi:hypothetical protein